jgi:hypothetical protein
MQADDRGKRQATLVSLLEFVRESNWIEGILALHRHAAETLDELIMKA